MTVDGYFQQYCAIKWRNAAHIPEGIDLETAAPLFCAGCTSFNAVEATRKELNRDPKDTWVGVIGCGGLGHRTYTYGQKGGSNHVVATWSLTLSEPTLLSILVLVSDNG
jgi:propanol-preferring alcohol dehydrogenase